MKKYQEDIARDLKEKKFTINRINRPRARHEYYLWSLFANKNNDEKPFIEIFDDFIREIRDSILTFHGKPFSLTIDKEKNISLLDLKKGGSVSLKFLFDLKKLNERKETIKFFEGSEVAYYDKEIDK